MRVLIVGAGGREHALAWKIAANPRLRELYVAPGNAGTASIATNVPIPSEDIDGLIKFALSRAIDLVVVGPEAPLAMGLVDRLAEKNIIAFGPSSEAARLEASKVMAKEFMSRNGIPTAAFRVFERLEEAREYVRDAAGPLVVKADGLAAGKGVVVCEEREEALGALEFLMSEGGLGGAGRRVVIEERLLGREASFLVFSDGERIVPMPPARDHKRVRDGDKGPNTGGMGAYSPLPDWTQDTEALATSILERTVRAMAREGRPFRGVLYGGFVLTADGPRVLEFNVRFGDPETQAILPRLESDLLDLIDGASSGNLVGVTPRWDPRASVCVVLASQGYPGAYKKGMPISGLNEPALEGVHVFHAGTAAGPVTSGGRVLAVTALGKDLEAARERAYSAVAGISFEGMVYRRDIGRP